MISCTSVLTKLDDARKHPVLLGLEAVRVISIGIGQFADAKFR